MVLTIARPLLFVSVRRSFTPPARSSPSRTANPLLSLATEAGREEKDRHETETEELQTLIAEAHMPHLAASSSAAAFAVSGHGRGGNHPVFRPPPPRSTPMRARASAASSDLGTATAQPTFYDLLGIPAEGSTTFEDVRVAYRRMARRYHPDVSPTPEAAVEHTRRFIQVQEAYETLSDPSRRQSYDRALARGVCWLAFEPAARNVASMYRQEMEEKSGWRTSWEGQIAELKKRSTGKDSEENLSWGAQMRRRAEQL